MDVSSKIRELMTSIMDGLNEQVWFQEIKTKFEELDPQSKTYLRFGLVGTSLLSIVIFTFSAVWRVHTLKVDLYEKKNILQMIQSANDEIRRLRDSTPAAGLASGDTPWAAYFDTVSGPIGIDKSNLNVANEKAGATTDQTKETLFDIGLKHVNIKQVVRFALALENGQRPVKLRNLTVDTKNDPTGYVDATLAISAFVPVVAK